MTEKQIVTRIRQIMYDRKISGTESNAGELNMLKSKLKDIRRQQGVTESFKNTYDKGDQVNTPLGHGTIIAVSPNINVDGRVKVKLYDPSRAGEDGKFKDTFVFDTTQLTHIGDQGVAEGSMGGINRCAPSSDVSYEKVLDDISQKWKSENAPLPEDESGIPMVKNNIKTIKRAATDLENSISDYDEIDEWAKEKIAVSKSMLSTVVDYIMSEKEQGNQVVEDKTGQIEAYGYAYNKRDQRIVWRKIFKSEEAAHKWADSKNATVLGTRPVEQRVKEAEIDEKAPCWKNYKQIGMKVKGGKQVPNCVPVSEHEVTLEGDAFIGIFEDSLLEADYHGHKVELNKPMQGDVKKFKVYVKDPSTGNIKKVNFGDPNMRIRKSNPGARKSFRARHHCENPGPKTKARFWSCKKW